MEELTRKTSPGEKYVERGVATPENEIHTWVEQMLYREKLLNKLIGRQRRTLTVVNLATTLFIVFLVKMIRSELSSSRTSTLPMTPLPLDTAVPPHDTLMAEGSPLVDPTKAPIYMSLAGEDDTTAEETITPRASPPSSLRPLLSIRAMTLLDRNDTNGLPTDHLTDTTRDIPIRHGERPDSLSPTAPSCITPPYLSSDRSGLEAGDERTASIVSDTDDSSLLSPSSSSESRREHRRFSRKSFSTCHSRDMLIGDFNGDGRFDVQMMDRSSCSSWSDSGLSTLSSTRHPLSAGDSSVEDEEPVMGLCRRERESSSTCQSAESVSREGNGPT